MAISRLVKVRRWVTRAVVIAAVAIGAASWAGARWETSEQAAFLDAGLTPPGEMVQISDRELHVRASGAGGPPVLFISGLGDDHATWAEIQDRLEDSIRVVSYDRPGLGWSPARADASTLDAAVEDIRLLLSQRELFDEPPIVVGHSLGGAVARRLAYRHPTAVSGLVLLDPTPISVMPLAMRMVMGAMQAGSLWSGSVGMARARLYRRYPDVTREQKRTWAHLYASGPRARAVRNEYRGAVKSEPIPLETNGLGELPLTVLAAPAVGPPGFGRMSRAVDEGKRLIASESRRGRLVAVNTSHYVHYDDPDRVVGEILTMVNLVADAPLAAVGEGG